MLAYFALGVAYRLLFYGRRHWKKGGWRKLIDGHSGTKSNFHEILRNLSKCTFSSYRFSWWHQMMEMKLYKIWSMDIPYFVLSNSKMGNTIWVSWFWSILEVYNQHLDAYLSEIDRPKWRNYWMILMFISSFLTVAQCI